MATPWQHQDSSSLSNISTVARAGDLHLLISHRSYPIAQIGGLVTCFRRVEGWLYLDGHHPEYSAIPGTLSIVASLSPFKDSRSPDSNNHRPPDILKEDTIKTRTFTHPHTKGIQVDMVQWPAMYVAPTLPHVSKEQSNTIEQINTRENLHQADQDRKSTRLNSSHKDTSRMPSSA